MQGVTEEEKYQIILKIRARATKPSHNHRTVRYQQEVCGSDGIKVNTTVFRPFGSEHDILPVVLFCHGGGWVFGNVDTYTYFINDLCIQAHVAVMAVDYTLSPERQFPVANTQAFLTLCWLSENARSIFTDPENIYVMGDSAGGNMATVFNLFFYLVMAKNSGKQVIKAQVLIYPLVSLGDTSYDSYQKYGHGDLPLSAEMTKFSACMYLPKGAQECHNLYMSPIVATKKELEGLPDALILTSECDILCDEGEAYAAKLLQAGVNTIGVRILGTVHEFISLPVPETPQYKLAVQTITIFLNDQKMK
ncbi:alpha/beta hydrolase fold-domain-containing protein [Thamnidium elegans]|nr:alpha/beta hydrolase fold-domain-containing protein [Thamnidium elegans]